MQQMTLISGSNSSNNLRRHSRILNSMWRRLSRVSTSRANEPKHRLVQRARRRVTSSVVAVSAPAVGVTRSTTCVSNGGYTQKNKKKLYAKIADENVNAQNCGCCIVIVCSADHRRRHRRQLAADAWSSTTRLFGRQQTTTVDAAALLQKKNARAQTKLYLRTERAARAHSLYF